MSWLFEPKEVVGFVNDHPITIIALCVVVILFAKAWKD